MQPRSNPGESEASTNADRVRCLKCREAEAKQRSGSGARSAEAQAKAGRRKQSRGREQAAGLFLFRKPGGSPGRAKRKQAGGGTY